MAKPKWYMRKNYVINPATLYYHNQELNYLDSGKFWRFLLVITEEELIELGTDLLETIRQKWIENSQHLKRCLEITKDEALKDPYNYQLQEAAENRENELIGYARVMTYINRLLSQTQPKPALPQKRTKAWGNEGDEVICCISEAYKVYEREIAPEEINTLIHGVIQKFSRGYIYIRPSRKTSLVDDGEDWKLPFYSSSVLLQSEYLYLKTNPDFCRLWMKYFSQIPERCGAYSYDYDFWADEFWMR